MVISNPLHNFNFPPGLTWGRQKFLRFMNVNPDPPIPAVNDNESSNSDNQNNHHSVNNHHAEVQEFHTFPRETSSDHHPRPKLRFKHRGTPPTTTPPQVVDPRSVNKSTRPKRNLEKKEERPKFSIGLSRKEIEEDFSAMTGNKPPRKHNNNNNNNNNNNKLSKSVQKKLNAVFPGSLLSEVRSIQSE